MAVEALSEAHSNMTPAIAAPPASFATAVRLRVAPTDLIVSGCTGVTSIVATARLQDLLGEPLIDGREAKKF